MAAQLLSLLSLLLTPSMFAQTSIHEFKFSSIDGAEHSFSEFAGKKIMIVNTASECGFTKQYEGLQALHERYQDKLVIVGFPANNFGQQEPGANEEIATFCKLNYGVTFLMAEKVSVTGEDMHPVFSWLCAQTNPDFTGEIKWNFEKFLLDSTGKLVGRHRSAVKPDDQKIIEFIEG